MKKILIIYDSNPFYTTRFMEFFKNDKDFVFEITVFTMQESLIAYLQTHQVEILVLGKPIIDAELPRDHINFICYLSEERYPEQELEQPQIYRYQRAPAVMDEVLAGYRRKNDKASTGNSGKAMKIITIFSPKGGFQELSFAWSIAFQLSKRKKVLFLPLELLPSHILPFLEVTNEKLSEFIYYLKENPESITKMKSLLSYHSSLSYLCGITHGFDLLSLSKEDMQKWISELQLHTDYQSVIFYLDYYNDAAAELQGLSDLVLIPMEEAPYQNKLFHEWEEQMARLGVSTGQENYQRIRMVRETVPGTEYGNLSELTGSPVWNAAAQYVNCL